MAEPSEPLFKKRRRGPAASAAVGNDSDAPTLRQLLSSGTVEDQHRKDGAIDSTEVTGDGEDEDGTSVQDLILLRQLQKRPTGIELDKLNKGEKKKQKKKATSNKESKTAEQQWADQMARGGLMNGADGNDDEDDDEQDKAGGSKKIVRNNFQGETNIVDVDKHMMTYIEEEMRKRSGKEGENAPSVDQVRAALNNPEDELYQVAEKYRSLQRQKPTEEEEGNVTLSTTMLTSIPEIDLGMDVRLKNIEETEKAKHLLAQQRRAAGGKRDEGDDQFAAARFYRPKYSTQSDIDALSMAREGLDPTAEINRSDQAGGRSGQASRAAGSERRATATDELVMERFKKRQRQHLK
ncbi:hypothetical protein OC861_003131 [Tilletia horrida]|nr:hypothetical protein OC861_003131 [Tilletia horrida]